MKSIDFSIGDVQHNLRFASGGVSVDGGEVIKFKTLQSSGNLIEKIYTLEIDYTTLLLYVDGLGGAHLTKDGVDVVRNEEYSGIKLGPAAIVFIVLYITNMVLVLGGALGGMFNFCGLLISLKFLTNSKLTKWQNVLIAAGIYVVITAVELVLAICVLKLRDSF